MAVELLGDLLIDVHKRLKMAAEASLKDYGIGMGQLQILMLFYKDPEGVYTQTNLSGALGVDKGNVSRSVAKLLEKRYLTLADPGRKAYGLSELGAALQSEITARFQALHREMVQGLRAEDLEKTANTLRQIAHNLEERS